MTKRPGIVFARPPSRIKRPKPAQPAAAEPLGVVYAPKRRGPILPSATIASPESFDRDARADAADRLWRELQQRVKGEGEP